MAKWDCSNCGLAFEKMMTPTEYRCKTFCSEKCRDEWKLNNPPKKKVLSTKNPNWHRAGFGIYNRDIGWNG